jgi:hypothetical protein
MVDSLIGSKSAKLEREEGLRKRENFAVNLRKKKKNQVLQVRRLRLFDQVSYSTVGKNWRDCGYYLDCQEIFRDILLIENMKITPSPTQNESAPYSFQQMLDHYIQPSLLSLNETQDLNQ